MIYFKLFLCRLRKIYLIKFFCRGFSELNSTIFWITCHSCLGLPLGPLLYSTSLRIYLFTGINDCLCHYESLYSLRSATSLAMFFPFRIPLAIYGLLCLFMDFMIFSSFVKSFEFWMNLIESVDYFWSKAISTLLILLTQQKGMSFYHLFCILFSVSQSVLLYRSFMSLDRVIFEYF